MSRLEWNIDWNGTSCRPLIDGFCSEDYLAVDSTCIENKCQCTTDQIQYSNNLCIKPHLGMICENDIDCDELLYSRCDRNIRCGCEPNYKEYNVTACAPLLGRYCSNDKLCALSHSSCLDNKCLCNFGFVKFSLEKCVPHHIGMECVENADCRLVLNSVCINNHCVCKSNHVGLNDKVCAPTLDACCKRNQQCAPSNSICVNNKCQCGHNYLRTTKNQCVTFNEYFWKSCENSNDCEDIQYSECSVTKKCTCKMNYIPLGDKKCIALIGAFCNDNDECISIDTFCINNKCQCRKNFYAHSKQQCYPIQLGTTCRNNDDCSEAIRNSKCSTDKRCNCIENHYALNEFKCAPYLFGNCFSDEDCKFNSSVCVGNKCMCKIDSRAVSDNQCQLIEYMYTCDNELDCGDPWHYRCDPDKRCRCNSNNYSINRSTCLPLLKGYCWKDSQCLSVNSACIDFHCQCRSNFIAICNNLCRPVDNLTQFFF
ncbi:uncharacterized protein LOC141533047 [Cotesia typhae]|uniref:uncharacterized protein LOC141533047 n=1 Tax=Cotesia typhae TaxID=2053667 RepID=UPI003D68FFC2